MIQSKRKNHKGTFREVKKQRKNEWYASHHHDVVERMTTRLDQSSMEIPSDHDHTYVSPTHAYAITSAIMSAWTQLDHTFTTSIVHLYSATITIRLQHLRWCSSMDRCRSYARSRKHFRKFRGSLSRTFDTDRIRAHQRLVSMIDESVSETNIIRIYFNPLEES